MEFRIVHNDDPVGFCQIHRVHPCPAGEHQTIVGIELGELTAAHLQVQHDPAPDRFTEIRPKKRQPCLPAHIAGAFKGQIGAGTGTEIQSDPLRTEHGLSFLLPLQPAHGAAGFKDAGKVHVEDDVGKLGDHRVVCGQSRLAAVEDREDLIEQRVVLLGLGSGFHPAVFRSAFGQTVAISVLRLFCVAQQ